MMDCCRICTYEFHWEPIDTLTELRPYPKLRSPESKIVTQSQVGESKEKGQKLQAGAEALSKRVVRSGAGMCGGHEELSK